MKNDKTSKYIFNQYKDWDDIFSTPLKYVDVIITANWRDDKSIKIDNSGLPILDKVQRNSIPKKINQKFYLRIENDLSIGEFLNNLNKLSNRKLLTNYDDAKFLITNSLNIGFTQSFKGFGNSSKKNKNSIELKFSFGDDTNEIYFRHNVDVNENPKNIRLNKRFLNVQRALNSFNYYKKEYDKKMLGVNGNPEQLTMDINNSDIPKNIKKAKHIKTNKSNNVVDKLSIEIRNLLFENLNDNFNNHDNSYDVIVNSEVQIGNGDDIKFMSNMMKKLDIKIDSILYYMENVLGMNIKINSFVHEEL